ncbi:MAG: hypothetical protein LBK95_12725 [Bifidobacteriaceae bacterium]|nr:hypothetical protein [Bifidobacteriaceae bacterium]
MGGCSAPTGDAAVESLSASARAAYELALVEWPDDRRWRSLAAAVKAWEVSRPG